MNKIILNRVNLDGFKLNPIGKQVDKKDFEYLVIDREFKFDKTAGGKTIKDGAARIETIKGNSVVWNQLTKEALVDLTYTRHGLSATLSTGKATVHITGVVSRGVDSNMYVSDLFPIDNAIVNHKYLLSISDSKNFSLTVYGFVAKSISDIPKGIIVTATQATPLTYALFLKEDVADGTTIDETIDVDITDLTKMFGAGNEPTTIEEFYARIPSGIDEYAYNEGEVIYNATDKIESVGVNQWGGELEEGKIQSGEDVSTQGMARSIGYINIIPNTAYYATCKYIFYPYFYDEDKNYIGTPNHVKTFTTPSNARYLRFFLYNSSGTVELDTQVCINISDPSVNGKYFPYVKREQNLDIIGKYFPQGMKSAGTTHDEIRYNKESGKWEKVVRIGEVDTGTLNWAYSPSSDVFYVELIGMKKPTLPEERITGLLSARYSQSSSTILANMADKQILRFETGFIYIKDSSYTDEASFKESLQGVMLYYELAEPIVTELEETINLDYPVWNVGTEKAIANVPSTPLKADIRYKILKNKLKLMTLNI